MGDCSHEFSKKDLGDSVTDSQERGGGGMVTEMQSDGRGRVGGGFARFLEVKMRSASGFADWGLRG